MLRVITGEFIWQFQKSNKIFKEMNRHPRNESLEKTMACGMANSKGDVFRLAITASENL